MSARRITAHDFLRGCIGLEGQSKQFQRAFPCGEVLTPDGIARMTKMMCGGSLGGLVNKLWPQSSDDLSGLLEELPWRQRGENAKWRGYDHEMGEAVIALVLALDEWEYEEKRGRVAECLEEPGNEQGKDHV